MLASKAKKHSKTSLGNWEYGTGNNSQCNWQIWNCAKNIVAESAKLLQIFQVMNKTGKKNTKNENRWPSQKRLLKFNILYSSPRKLYPQVVPVLWDGARHLPAPEAFLKGELLREASRDTREFPTDFEHDLVSHSFRANKYLKSKVLNI